MLPDWKIQIGDLLQLPYCYCEHTRDVDTQSEYRKDHVHIIVHSPTQLSDNQIRRLFTRLALPGECCFAPIGEKSAIINIRHCYNYLIHDTESCKLLNKHLYPISSRIEGNGFDIGLFEQIDEKLTIDIIYNIKSWIIDNNITNMRIFEIRLRSDPLFQDLDFYQFQKILKSNYGYFQAYIKGNYLHAENFKQKDNENNH